MKNYEMKLFIKADSLEAPKIIHTERTLRNVCMRQLF